MGALNCGTHFAPAYPGDRLFTVLSIFNLLEATDLLDDTAIKAPKGWTKDVTKKHVEKIKETVFKESPSLVQACLLVLVVLDCKSRMGN